MIKIRCDGRDVTIKAVKVTLNKNIKEILLDYVGKRKVDYIVEDLVETIGNDNLIIFTNDDIKHQIKINAFNIPEFTSYTEIYTNIRDCLINDGLLPEDAAECAHLIYSLEEVPEESDEEKIKTSQDVKRLSVVSDYC